MSPYVECYQDYVKRGLGTTFMSLVSSHLQHGFVFTTEDFFAVGRPIRKDSSDEMIQDPSILCLEPNCWHIGCFWGDVSKLWEVLDILPIRLGFVSWYKTKDDKKELHVFRIERLRRFYAKPAA